MNIEQPEQLKSPSAVMDARVLYATLCILNENGGTLPRTEMVDLVEKRITPTDWEKELVEVSGEVRWISALNFRSIDFVKSGYLEKNRGVWNITSDGIDALELGEVDLFLTAKKKYKEWRDGRVSPKVKKK
tara:strand:- start:115 stop:507 length:393 start_codon:yes stop_codon:yes gene_type:complete